MCILRGFFLFFFFSSRRRHTRCLSDWSSDVCSSDLLLALSGFAGAQNFPDRTLTMIIPFAAGGPTDVLGRVIAQRMGELLGQTVIVENIGGAGGMTGSKRVADARPDGYTMLLGTVGTHAQ